MKAVIAKLLVLAAIVLVFITCEYHSDNIENTPTKVEIRLNTTSASYDEVNLDIEGIYINDGSTNAGWKRLQLVKPGICNILDNTNGLDMLLAKEEISLDSIAQVRLVLASNNSVVKDNEKYSLTPSLIIIDVNNGLNPGNTCKLWIDIDVERSIVKNNSNKYVFQSVARTYTEESNGAIEGRIRSSEDVTINAWAVLDDTKILSVPDKDGSFRMPGLQTSSDWTVIYEVNKYHSIEYHNIAVKAGSVTKLKPFIYTGKEEK